jgi:glycosyltransferase involved in cell wall biosynthesis
MKWNLEITIPVLNEEEELERSVSSLYSSLEGMFQDQSFWSTVIADNGSSDRTPDIARKLEKKYPSLKYLRLEERGVGRALKASWKQSEAAIVGYMDLDLATDLKHLPEAVSAITELNYDLVYGTRLHRKSVVTGRSLKREITSRMFNLILKIYLGVHFSDGMCGFKFLRRNIFEDLHNGGAVSDGWFFATELLVVGERSGMKLYELPVHWTDSSDSKVRIVSLAIEYLNAMRTLKRRAYRNAG